MKRRALRSRVDLPPGRLNRCLALLCALLSFSGSSLAATDAGIDISFVYDGLAFSNLHGGLSRGSTYSGNLDVQLTIDLNKVTGWRGAMIYADALWIHGGQPSSLVGDAQGTSKISAPVSAQMEELWLQQQIPGLPLSALFGLYDLNSEFYRLQSAQLFVNSSFGIGPEFAQTGLGGPSIFPNTSLGLRLAYKPDPGVIIRAAAMDGVPIRRPDGSRGAFEPGNGALLVSEVAFLARAGDDAQAAPQMFGLGRFPNLPPYDHKLALGIWHYTATFDDVSDVDADGQALRRHGSSGAYIVTDHVVARSADDPDRRTMAFLQLGIGDRKTARFGSYAGTGVVVMRPFGRRAEDQLGFGVAIAANGSHYLKHQQQQGSPAKRAEVAVELSYLAKLTSLLTVQPDLQYIIHPDTDAARRNALAFMLRFEISTSN